MKINKIIKYIVLVLILLSIIYTSNYFTKLENLKHEDSVSINRNDSKKIASYDTHHSHVSSLDLKGLQSVDIEGNPQMITERKRRQLWEANFPWQPTHDPKLKFNPSRHFTQRSEKRKGKLKPLTNTEMATASNHYVLKNFFNDDFRFTPQFEKFYGILNDHGRGHNPAEAAGVFLTLRRYYYSAFENDSQQTISDADNRVLSASV